MAAPDVMLFSLASGQDLMLRVAQELGISPGQHEERDFEDGEFKIRPLESVRNREVFVLQSLYSDEDHSVNDKLIRLLFFLGALGDAGARRLHAIIPYLCYARKDRRTKSRDPLSIRYIAQLFESIGIDTITVLDVHNPAAFESAFRCPTIHLSARELLIDHFVPLLTGKAVTVASPDIGGAKRAEAFRQALCERLNTAIGSAVMYKQRSEGKVSGDLVAGEIDGRSVVIVDDLIAGGTTMQRATEALIAQGATEVYATATHGVFGENAVHTLATPALKQVVVTNTIESRRLETSQVEDKLARLDISPMIAQAIRRLHNNARN